MGEIKRLEKNFWNSYLGKEIEPKQKEAYLKNRKIYEKLDFWDEGGISAFKDLKSNLLILNVGCGIDTYDDRARWTAIDISSKAVRFSKKASSSGNFCVADAENLPFKNSTFDLILATNILHHLEKPKACLRECRRVVKLKGKLITVDPNRYNPIGMLSRKITKALHFRSRMPPFPVFILSAWEKQFSRIEYAQLFYKAGFSEVTIRPHRIQRVLFFLSVVYPTISSIPLFHELLYSLELLGEKLIKLPIVNEIAYFWIGEACKTET